MKKIVIISLITLSFFGCEIEKIDNTEISLGKDYLPIEKGRSSVYHIKRINFLTTGVDTIHSFRKELIDSSFIEGGEEKFFVKVFSKKAKEDSWVLDSLWSIYGNNQEVVINRNNTLIKLLSFPLEKERTWDINVFNVRPVDNITLKTFTNELNIDSCTYNDIVLLQFPLIDNFIDKNDRRWYYGRNEGLVYKYEEVTRQQPGEVKEGYILEEKLIADDKKNKLDFN